MDGYPLGDDTSKDYVLLSAVENNTHTIVTFQRKINTCDEDDLAITVRSN